MPNIKCKICNNKFYSKPNWIVKGWGKYCSNQCKYIGQKSGILIDCFICGKRVYKSQKELKNSKSKKYFCSKSCQTKWRNSIFIGPKHANWKHGEKAYRNILNRHKISKVCRLCETNDDRVLVVHHVDRNRKNNKLSNLLWLCCNCHFLVHHYNEERQKLMVPIA